MKEIALGLIIGMLFVLASNVKKNHREAMQAIQRIELQFSQQPAGEGSSENLGGIDKKPLP